MISLLVNAGIPKDLSVPFYCCAMDSKSLMIAIVIAEVALCALATLAKYDILPGFEFKHYASLVGCATVMIVIDAALGIKNCLVNGSISMVNEREYIDNLLAEERALWESKPDRPGEKMGTETPRQASIPHSVRYPTEL